VLHCAVGTTKEKRGKGGREKERNGDGKNIGAAVAKQNNERVKGRTSAANAERKPSLIKDKGISAASRLAVTTTSASHSLQRPLSEKPSLHPHRPPASPSA
jgi:hypothetical protein